VNRIALRIALLLTASLTLGACSSDDGEKVIKIGAAVSETGRYAEEGEHTRQGYRLWEDWVNNEYGGVKVGGDRYEVELVMYDDRGNPDTTAALVEQLIGEDEVDFMLGPYSSTLTQRAIEVADARGTILVEGSGASETLFRQSYQNLFAVLTPAGNYTQSALQTLAEMGARSVVIAHADALFPASVAGGAERWAGEYGLEVLGVERYSQDATDARSILSTFKDLDPDVFVGGGYFNDAVLFLRTAKELDFNPKAMVLTVGPTDPELIEEVGEDAYYLIGPTQWEASMSYEGDYFGSASDYAERYAAKWGGPPTYQSASATAAALALHLAIEAAGSLDANAVRAALHNLDVDTFYGRISFDSTGKNTAKPMGAIQIQNGDIRVVAPPNAAVAGLLYPAPNWKDR
jgi:branched-chain amino acid transport system substrate-binding protein